MKIYKKIFFRLLKIVPLTAVIIFILGIAIYEIAQPSSTELPQQEFIDLAIDQRITTFNYDKYTFTFEDRDGTTYSHKFKDYKEVDHFQNQMLKNNLQFSSIQKDHLGYFYLPFAGLILSLILIIFSLYFLMLWLVCFYDLLKSEFKEQHNKWMWFIAMVVLPFLTPVYYILIAGDQKAEITG